MQPYQADAAAPNRTGLHLTLLSFLDETVGTLARLFAYVGTLALLAILGLAGLGQLPTLHDDEPALRPGWTEATRSHPAFAVSRVDSVETTVSYTILRHPEGGRRDVIRWADDGTRPVAELEIYRPGGEFDPVASLRAYVADRMGLDATASLEEAGLIQSKFGPVALVRLSGGSRSCLGYLMRAEEPALLISGWSCQGDTLSAHRAAVGCTLNRLTLLASGNEPKLAELFAHAELKRRSCGLADGADWLTRADNAELRGAL